MRFIPWFIAATVPASVFAQAAGKSPASSMFGSVMPMMVVMFVIIYFLMIRPEQRKQKQRQKMISEMKKGDRVLTIGGMYGVIHNIKGEIVTLKIADNTNVEVTKIAVSNVVTNDTGSKDDKESK